MEGGLRALGPDQEEERVIEGGGSASCHFFFGSGSPVKRAGRPIRGRGGVLLAPAISLLGLTESAVPAIATGCAGVGNLLGRRPLVESW